MKWIGGSTIVLAGLLSVAPAAPVPQPHLTPVQLEALQSQEGRAVSEPQRVDADEIDELLADGKVLFLDVREPKELEDLGTIEGSINIPIGQLEERLDELPKDRAILTA